MPSATWKQHVGKDENGKKIFIPLENNPSLLTPLAHDLGLIESLAFHDLYSFTEPDLIALVPRPALALLFVWPCTEGAQKWHAEDVEAEKERGVDEEKKPVMWFRQDVTHACGLMGIIHCTLNIPKSLIRQLDLPPPGIASIGGVSNTVFPHLHPSTPLAKSLHDSRTYTPTQSQRDIQHRADLISKSPEIEELHTKAAISGGDSRVPKLGEEPGHAFIAFVKDEDGGLWELDGARTGPKFLGTIGQDDDLLSPAALQLGPLPFIEREEARSKEASMSGGTVVRGVEFSCTVLAPKVTEKCLGSCCRSSDES